MVVAFVRVDFGDAKGEEGHGEEFEGVLCGGVVCDGGEEGVLLCGFGVGGRLDGSDGSFYWGLKLVLSGSDEFREIFQQACACLLTFEHVFPPAIQDTGPGLQILGSQEIGHGNGLWIFRRARVHRNLTLLALSLWRLGLSSSLSSSPLLCLRLQLQETLLVGAGLQLLDVCLRGHSLFCGLRDQLLSSHVAELVGRHSVLCGFGFQALFHFGHLLWRWLAWGRHVGQYSR